MPIVSYNLSQGACVVTSDLQDVRIIAQGSELRPLLSGWLDLHTDLFCLLPTHTDRQLDLTAKSVTKYLHGGINIPPWYQTTRYSILQMTELSRKYSPFLLCARHLRHVQIENFNVLIPTPTGRNGLYDFIFHSKGWRKWALLPTSPDHWCKRSFFVRIPIDI